MLFQNRLLTRAAPIQSHDRKGVVSATNAQRHEVEGLDWLAAPLQTAAQWETARRFLIQPGFLPARQRRRDGPESPVPAAKFADRGV